MRAALFRYPLLELWSLIELGAQTSASLAVLWALSAGFLGMATVRFAGAQVLSRLQAAHREGVLQQQLVGSDMALATAGLLLIIPGLISDAMAVLLLIRPLRRLLGSMVSASWSKGVNHAGKSCGHRHIDQGAFHARQTRGDVAQQDDGVTLEGEFQELDADVEPLLHQGSDEPDSR